MIKKIMDNKESFKISSLIAKYLGGNASKLEIQELEEWVNESDENRTYFRHLKRIWEATEEIPISTENALERVLSQINSQYNGMTFWYFWQKVAAVMLIPLLISTIWLGFNKKSEIYDSNPINHKAFSAFGTFSIIDLPDGSKVWLNSGSSLQYPDRFSKSSRTVHLIGEAYFEVQSNTESPFFVSTPSVTVKATGTRFNVQAYKDCIYPAITLIEGKVAVLKQVKDQKDSLIALLQPKQNMKYNLSTGQIVFDNEDTYKYIAWKDGKLVFRNDLITEVVKRIGIQYNVDIEVEGEEIKQYRYRATFENEPLSELLRLLKISSPIDYREIKPKLLPDGSFTRRKIIIFSTSN